MKYYPDFTNLNNFNKPLVKKKKKLNVYKNPV